MAYLEVDTQKAEKWVDNGVDNGANNWDWRERWERKARKTGERKTGKTASWEWEIGGKQASEAEKSEKLVDDVQKTSRDGGWVSK
jgi:hypothetical protein